LTCHGYPCQVLIESSSPELCRLPYSLPLYPMEYGLTFLRELFYEPPGRHYRRMLETLTSCKLLNFGGFLMKTVPPRYSDPRRDLIVCDSKEKLTLFCVDYFVGIATDAIAKKGCSQWLCRAGPLLGAF